MEYRLYGSCYKLLHKAIFTIMITEVDWDKSSVQASTIR
jgi:hypothetical protein